MKKKPKGFFELPEWWEKEWKGMPEFIQEAIEFEIEAPFKTVGVCFRNGEDLKNFSELIGQTVTVKTKSIWYPQGKREDLTKYRYIDKDAPKDPKYPIYVPTKGRFDSRMTIRELQRINVPFYVVIESHEYDLYSKILDKDQILVLPWSKPDSSTELVKTRNWIKAHSISNGDKRHWQIDDNIQYFFRLNRNIKAYVESGTIFRVMEDFVDRYENVAIAGPNYDFFARKRKLPPFYLNTRIYSQSLILNNIPYQWRGVYNDDTDICLRVLKDGWCTVLFNAFLGKKTQTMTVSGGNTPIYLKGREDFDGRLEMAKSLQKQHPDVAKVRRKWGRWQHHVNYKIFRKNSLIRKKGLKIQKGINNYGMEFKVLS